MARKKRAVALFEVIHQAKPFERKLSPRPAMTPIPPPAIEFLPPQKPTTPTIPLSTRISEAWARWQAVAEKATSPALNWTRNFVAQQGSILAGIATALAVIGAITLARHVTHPSHANEPVSFMQSVRAQPPQPSVLAIDHTVTTVEMAQDQHSAQPATPLPNVDITAATPASSTLQPAARQINLNYVLVQSYADEKTAQSACDFLNKNSVNCTVERQIRNWRRDFFYVVGLQGFARASGADYQAYRKRLDELSVQFASPHNRYKRFDPMAIKWLSPDATDPASTDR